MNRSLVYASAGNRPLRSTPYIRQSILARACLALATAAICFAAAGCSDPTATGLVGRPAPDFTLQTLDGRSVTLSDFKDNVVVLDFWATWCSPCLMELPVLERVRQRFRDKRVQFLAVSVDSPRTPNEVIGGTLQRLGVNIPALHDRDGVVSRLYRQEGIPMLVLVDASGIVQSVHVGYGPGTETEVTRELDSLLANRSLL